MPWNDESISALLADLKAAAASDRYRGISGIRVGGSFGRGDSSEKSDLDLFLLVDQGALPRYLHGAVDELVRMVGLEVAVRRGPVEVPLFGHSFSFDIVARGLLQVNVSGSEDWKPTYMQAQRTRVVLDRHGQLESTFRAARGMSAPLDDLREDAASLLWFRMMAAVKEHARSETLQASKYFGQVVDAVAILLRVDSDIAPPGSNWREPARGLGKVLDADSESALERAVLAVAQSEFGEAFGLLEQAVAHVPSVHQLVRSAIARAASGSA